MESSEPPLSTTTALNCSALYEAKYQKEELVQRQPMDSNAILGDMNSSDSVFGDATLQEQLSAYMLRVAARRSGRAARLWRGIEKVAASAESQHNEYNNQCLQLQPRNASCSCATTCCTRWKVQQQKRKGVC